MKRIALLAALLAPLGAAADKADRDKPTQIEANRMSADDARRMTIFEGAVVLTRGTIRLTADRIIVRQDAEGFQLATATGTPARFRQRQDPKPPDTQGIWIEGEALRMELDDKSGKVEMFESARLTRGGDEVAGAYILYDQRSDFFSVNSAKDATAPGSGRVKAVLQPKPRADKAAK